MMNRIATLILATTCLFLSVKMDGQTEISGELKQWHKVTLTFKGPESSEKNNTGDMHT